MRGRDVYISWAGGEVFLRGRSPSEYGLFVNGDGVEGWDSSPETKVSLFERQAGDGAHAVDDRMVLYSARTVTVNFHAHGSSRDEVTRMFRDVAKACHRNVRVRVVDGSQDTFVTGYVRPDIEARWDGNWGTGSMTVVCPDPRRYSTGERRADLLPLSSGSGGLFYGEGLDGLVYPLDYGEQGAASMNVATCHNGGTSTAYPTIYCHGEFPDGVSIHCGELLLEYERPVGGVPLVVDCLSGTASVGGTDVTRGLTSRGFPTIPPGSSVTMTLQSRGTGFVTVSWRDTYI